ncbi:MAG: hypothetical protein J6R68_02835, partial [Clostridia bacterium]|nr:hypothetical protein [Clostridia bacterium]
TFAVCGFVSELTSRKTKSGKFITSFTLSDYSGAAKVIAFDVVFSKYRHIIANGSLIAANVSLNAKEDESGCEMLLVSALRLSELAVSVKNTLYVKVPDDESFNKTKEICAQYKGNGSLCIYHEGKSQLLKSDSSRGINLCSELFNNLCSLLGRENVKIK